MGHLRKVALLVVFLASTCDAVAIRGVRRQQNKTHASLLSASHKPSIIAPPEDGRWVDENADNVHIKLVQGKLKAHLDAWLKDVLSDKFDEDPKKCAKETEEMLEELRYAYTRRLVPSVLRDECKHFLYYETFGSDEEVCYAIVEHLINTWKGDKDYETWCKEAYAKRHTAKDASEIPKKKDPGPRKGKYADVEEFSYPNDADPEKPCHGAKPCNGKGEKSDEPSALAKDDSPVPREKTEPARSGATGRDFPLAFLLVALVAAFQY